MDAYDQINSFLFDIWGRINKIEERALATGLEADVSITEIHIIEKIGDFPNCRMTDVARAIGITLATLTVACDKLEGKDLILRTRDTRDKRVVLVSLTPKGAAAYAFHRHFHNQMMTAALQDMTTPECEALVSALDKLRVFFETMQQAM